MEDWWTKKKAAMVTRYLVLCIKKSCRDTSKVPRELHEIDFAEALLTCFSTDSMDFQMISSIDKQRAFAQDTSDRCEEIAVEAGDADKDCDSERGYLPRIWRHLDYAES